MRDTFSTIPADLSLVATRNWGSYRNSFDECLQNGDCQTDYMLYGSHSQAFTIAITDGLILKVLRPNGQPTTGAGSQIF
jgi:hypothetical protein